MDTLHIQSLAVETHIGIHHWEQRIKRRLLLDIQIPIDCQQIADDLAKTIDYFKLCEHVTHYVENNTFQLIETVAEKVAILIKTEFAATEVSVTVSKPYAIKNAGNIQVTVNR